MSILLAAAASTLVFCAPGYPGAAGDAQPFVDEFAKAAVTAAGWPAGSLSAVYDPTDQGGVTKLGGADAVLAFVPYPFYVEHAAQLHLMPIAQADVVGVGTKEKWSLVAKTGRVTGGPSLAGYTIVSVAGYSPNFVIHSALSAWQVPAAVKVEPVGQILSALRRVASGDQVAALLDQTQSVGASNAAICERLESGRAIPRRAGRHCRRRRQPATRGACEVLSGRLAEVGEGGGGGREVVFAEVGWVCDAGVAGGRALGRRRCGTGTKAPGGKVLAAKRLTTASGKGSSGKAPKGGRRMLEAGRGSAACEGRLSSLARGMVAGAAMTRPANGY